MGEFSEVSMKNLRWLTNNFAPYHDYLFSHLLKIQGLNLIVYYRHRIVSSHPWKENEKSKYRNHVLHERPFGFDLAMVWRTLYSKDFFAIAGWNCMTYIMMITILSLRNRTFAIFTDTPQKRKGSFKQALKNSWLRFIFRKNSKARLLVTGQVGVDVAKSIWGLKPHQVYNFPTVTDHVLFSPSDQIPSMHDECLKFATVGRLVLSHKGQDIAIKALGKALGNRQNYEFLIVGTGPDEMQIRTLVNDLDLNNHVKFLGWKQTEELPSIYNATHFTIHSSHEDPYPNAIMESLSCGTPVIGSDKAGSTERIVPGVHGFVHTAGNVDDLAEKIKAALKLTHEEYSQMRRKSREIALQWSVDHNIEIVETIFCK